MRNLKRALSFAMATFMLLGMMVVGAGAASYGDFSDKDKIVNTEAVEILNQLNIITGNPDGSYNPTGIVKRSEMAKMICIALNGGVDPVLGNATNNVYKDTVGHWAAGYIEFCTNLGIVAGFDGNFRPEDTVTGTEAAKMLLVAIGYNPSYASFTGAQWAINVNVAANEKKLYNGLTINASEGLTRDNAAQMIYNGVQAKMVKYEFNWIPDGGSITSRPQLTDDTYPVTSGTARVRTILNYKYGVDTYKGIVLANEYAALGNGIQKKDQILFQPILINDATALAAGGGYVNPITVKVATGFEELAKNVTLLIKDKKINNVYTEVYGSPIINEMNNIYTTNARKGDSGSDLSSFTSAVKSEGVSLDRSNATPVFVNYDGTTIGALSTVTGTAAIPADGWANLAGLTANGATVEVIDADNDGIADCVLVYAPYIGQVTTYNEKGNSGDGSFTIANKGAVNAAIDGNAANNEIFADVVGIEDVEKDDMVSYIKVNDKFYVEKLEAVEGVVKVLTGLNKVTLDSTTYTASDLANIIDEDGTDVNYHRTVASGSRNTGLKDGLSVGDDSTLYLDPNGYVAYVKGETSVRNYLFITDIEITGGISGVKAKAAFSDGTTGTITVNSVTSDTKGDNTSGTTKYSGFGGSTNNSAAADKNLFYWDSGASSYTFGQGTTLVATGGGAATDGDIAPTVFTYSVKKDGTYDLKTIGGAGGLTLHTVTANTVAITRGNANISGVGAKYADEKTVFALQNTAGDWSTFIGIAAVPNVTTHASEVTYAVSNDRNDAIEAVFAPHSNVAGNYKSIYILDSNVDARQDDKGNDIYTIAALVDGEYVPQLQIDGAAKGDKLSQGAYTTQRLVGEIIDMGDLTYDAFALPIQGLKDRTIWVNTANTAGDGTFERLTINSKTKIMVIYGSGEKDISEGSIGDLVFDSNNAASCSKAVAVRASETSTDAGYGVAAYIYVDMT